MSSEALPMGGMKLSLQFFQAEEQKFIILKVMTTIMFTISLLIFNLLTTSYSYFHECYIFPVSLLNTIIIIFIACFLNIF